jgi:protein SPT2
MGKVGVIQHRAIDKPLKKKEREAAAKGEQKPGLKTTTGGKPYLGSGKAANLPTRDGPKNGASKDSKQASKQRPGTSVGDAPEKKIKKSATATTGYTGTARPVPGSSNKPSSARSGRPSSSRPGGGLLAPPKPSRGNRYEEDYDEELDDFIDYDEEDDVDPRGRGYGYDSDGSSDMEAGMSDIDDEERRAEYLARAEDKREQQMEERLKREKEERKRRWAQGGR